VAGGSLDRYEAVGDAAADVLGGLRLKIPIQSFFPATKPR